MGAQISIRSTAAELSNYSPEREFLGSQKIGGTSVSIQSPKVVPAKNRNKLVMEFQIDAHRGSEPSTPRNEDIVTVYRELLEIHQPKNIGMFGSSGGCTLAQTTIRWLPQQKLPLPGDVGLNTCSGGSNPGDAR